MEVAGKPYETIFGQYYWDAFAEARPYYEDALTGVVRTGDAFYADEVELMLVRYGLQWLSGTQLEQKVSLEDYSVSNRDLRSGLTGTPWQVQDRIAAFERIGVDFFLLQCSPQLEEMERFSESIITAHVSPNSY